MNILLLTETLHPGGAETFVVRLANALQARGHRVFLFVVHPGRTQQEIAASLHPSVRILNFQQKAARLRQKFDGLLCRLGIDFSLLQRDVSKALAAAIREHKISVVHSHLFKPDYYVACLNRKQLPPFRHVATHHGDYLLYRTQRPYGIRQYGKKLAHTVASLQAMAVISTEQQKQFAELGRRFHPGLSVPPILNGYEVKDETPISRESLGIGAHDFVIGMVARGIPEKGWELLINAFLSLQLPDAQLVLVGAGPETDRLRLLHGQHKNIHFAGYTANTTGYIRLFDVGVLPSYYKAESLPTVIIEYLYCNKPVIATDIGEVRSMLQTETGAMAGLLLPLSDKMKMEADLADALQRLYQDRGLREQLASRAAAAFQKFDMQTCVARYEAIYEGKPDPASSAQP